MTLEQRLQRLEDDRAIRDVKARYLRAADSRDVEAIRACFTPDARIEFEGFPPFDNRDAFVAVYQQMACVKGIFDIHHGANGVVRFEDDRHAHGQWSLFFHNINLPTRMLTQFGVEYDDSFVKGDDGVWRMTVSRSRRTSALVHKVDDEGHATVAAMGELEGMFGES